MDLSSYFKRSQVVILNETEKQPVIRELTSHLSEIGLVDQGSRYYAQVIHRESVEPTGIGNGFAIPHARTESVDTLISVLGISREGIDYQSIDDKPVNYVLLSIFPSSMSTTYLYMIGMMARILSSDEKRKELDGLTDPKKIYSYLTGEAGNYFDSLSEKDQSDFDEPANLTGVPSTDLDLLIRLDRLYQLYDSGKKDDAVINKIKGLKKLIDNRSLTYYERMRKKRSNPFAIVEKSSCSGCHLEIPPIETTRIREGKGLSVCTHCGRFLILV